MLPLSRILVPVDFSDHSLGMIPYVKQIARNYKAEIILLHVVNPVYAIPATGITTATMVDLPEWVFTMQAKRLDEFATPELNGFSVRRLIYEGEPDAQIIATARAEDVHLVIMPTHGYGVFRKFLIGSVTAKVLHDLEIPVLTGAHLGDSEGPGKTKISNLVCALGAGPHRTDTLTWAARLASDFQAVLSVVHAIPRAGHDVDEDTARQEIGRLLTSVGVRNTSICIPKGDMAHTVSEYAKSVGADLLVIGRGSKDSQGGRLRSNSYGIIRQSHCPVLSV
ncbi:MAG TPA: universal stress protein [Bryobacteraceae bacterium]|nr:universal stress protein [Bryobacteraceae bacterium]